MTSALSIHPSERSLVRLDNAGVFRASRWLVRGISLAIRAGEIVTLIGPNGSGKSTTARMALGLMEPDEGTAERTSGIMIGYVPQKLAIEWTLPLTVERFMNLTGRLARTDLTDALEMTGTSALKCSEIRTLSGGEFQRVLLARAIARRPDLLVLDEPVQGVDYTGEAKLYDLIQRVRKDLNCGVLLISHDLHVVMAATDRVVCLNGHVCCEGTPKAVAANDEYRKLFGARAAASLAVYEHDHDHTHLDDGRVRLADGTITDGCPTVTNQAETTKPQDCTHAG